jgi:nucleotide-binding universal stress UspA family protein
MSAYIVGIDGSGPSNAALDWAVARAVALSTPVTLVHVIEDEWGLAGSDFAREAMFAGEALLQDAQERARSLSSTVTRSARILHGSPVWELANVCGDDDLLVVGTHKTGFLQGRVLGSRSVALAGSAPCSVAVIPVGRSSSRHGVVAGVVRADGMERAVAAAAREAARIDEPLTLLHASPPRPGSTGRDDDDQASIQRVLMREATAAAHAAAPGVEVHSRVSGRRPVDALLDASRYATMLVLEPSRRTGPAVSMVGSTTHDVLMNINSPVLVARGTAV